MSVNQENIWEVDDTSRTLQSPIPSVSSSYLRTLSEDFRSHVMKPPPSLRYLNIQVYCSLKEVGTIEIYEVKGLNIQAEQIRWTS